MNRVIEALEQEHCDVEDALKRCMNMEDLYLELLELFAQDDQIDRLLEAYENKEAADVFFHSHTLKGVYTNLGMKHLFELDEPIVERTRDKQPDSVFGLEENVRALYEEHKRIAAIIRENI
ncbi:MAG: hypothetical protein KH268_04800 [Clostridiales bacterium]|uniref:HPt domain-containing protein n=1 Tax=Candidatus Anaerobutyricum stercoripullorum TaxID=2838456 RepID=A0A9D1X5P9_9FIRM|nr:hypothetical protein [Clostridiales bacterium]HIX72005.1 hypothetical protein [Candidatus Anaerobutyricum stercoripullorum]